MNKFFDLITGLLNGFEDSAINTVSAIVPWFVPIIPAYLTYWHSSNDLGFPGWVGWTAACVVEFLGLASMRTSVSFYEHNRRYSAEVKKAPFWITVLTYLFYLAVVLTVNVLLDLQNGVQWQRVLAIGLFSMLSVPSAVLISVRAQHTELLRELAQNKAKRSGVHFRTAAEPQERSPEPTEQRHASQFEPQIYQLLEDILLTENRIAGPSELARKLNLDPERSKGFISTKTKEWRNQKGLIQ